MVNLVELAIIATMLLLGLFLTIAEGFDRMKTRRLKRHQYDAEMKQFLEELKDIHKHLELERLAMRKYFVALFLSVMAVVGVSSIASATTYQQMYQSGNTSKCMYSEGTADLTAVGYETCSGAGNDSQWAWTPISGDTGYYKIVNHNGSCLVDPGSGGQGTAIDTTTCNNNLDQRWEPSPLVAGSSYDQWVNKGAGLCLDGGNSEIRSWTCNETSVQGWTGP